MQLHSHIQAIYTDGSGGFGTYGGRGVCGYAAIVCFETQLESQLETQQYLTLGGNEANSTHQRAEIWALIIALEYLQQHLQQHPSDRPIPIFSDSKYVIDALNGHWITKWQHNNWLNTKNKAIADRDLWLRLYQLQSHPINTCITFHHIMGHSDALGKKGRLAQLKNLDRFGSESTQHNQGNQLANFAAGEFRRGRSPDRSIQV